MTRRTFAISLGIIAAVSVSCRLGYTGWQAAHDPAFAHPALDGGLYVEWARSLAGGAGEPPGAFYLAPLFPHLLAVFLATFGESWRLLFLVQHAIVVGAAVCLACAMVARVGEGAALLAGAAALSYHPTAFFASRPIGEPIALLLATLGLYFFTRPWVGSVALAGAMFGLAALARPNLLLMALGLALVEVAGRRWGRAVALTSMLALTLAPVAVRNYSASGHAVLVSSNGGMTLYHGNGPGALGIFTPAAGFSGTVAQQQEEATVLARARTGVALDPVDADRWWGRQALLTRARDPLGTAALIARRVALTIDDYEHGLDDAPALDANPWRRAFPVPLAVLLGLSAAGVLSLGLGRTGGSAAWIAIAAAAVTPVAFYVSSRYRLPMVWFLSIPAGAGAASLVGAARTWTLRGRPLKAAAGGLIVALGSLLVPSGSLARTEESAGHANRAAAFAEVRDWARAEAEARRALALDPSSVLGRYNLGVISSAAGRGSEAEALYREALALDPSHAESAGNLAKILVERGAAGEAVPILERALASRPADAACWTNLVVAFLAQGDGARARDAVSDGERGGVRFAPELLEAVGERGR